MSKQNDFLFPSNGFKDGFDIAKCMALGASLHKTIPRLHVEQEAPLPDHPEVQPIDYGFLLRVESEGRESLPVQARNNIIDVIVQEILNRIKTKANA